LADATAAFLRVADESKLPAMTVPSMVEKFIEAKTNEGLSAFYVGDIKHKLNRFARAFRGHIGSVRSEEITQWLSKQGGGRNANNLRAAVATLFSFAREHGFLAREKRHAAELVRKVKERPSPIGIYSPDELTAIMKHAPSRLVAPLAIAAFAGLRITEIFRLEWREVSLERGHIVVEAAKAKTASRRIVPILPALAAWLKVRAKKTGHVAPEYMNLENISRLFSGVCLDAGVTPQRNGFRHSFASYRLASVKSADQVALEMGNSPRKLFSNYRELVTEQDAERWFSVVPAKKKAGKRGGVPKKKPSAGKQS
jgi:integrase